MYVFNKESYLKMTFEQRGQAKLFMSANEKNKAQRLDKKIQEDGNKLLKNYARSEEEEYEKIEEKESIREQIIDEAGIMIDALSGIARYYNPEKHCWE